MLTDKMSPCCFADVERVRLSCSSDWCGETVTERWEEIRCVECGSPYDADELLDWDQEVAA